MSTKVRIQYYDALKALAILGVIFLHSFLLWNPSVNILNHSISNLEHIGRFGVPVFLLISGALLLGRFIRKEWSESAIPYCFSYS